VAAFFLGAVLLLYIILSLAFLLFSLSVIPDSTNTKGVVCSMLVVARYTRIFNSEIPNV
jgi:hypothetical protein